MKSPDKDLFTSWYRRWFHQLDEPPPEEIWDHLSESLDLDEVWQGISQTLDAADAKTAEKQFSWPVSLILLLFCLMIPAFPLSEYMVPQGNRSGVDLWYSDKENKIEEGYSAEISSANIQNEEPEKGYFISISPAKAEYIKTEIPVLRKGLDPLPHFVFEAGDASRVKPMRSEISTIQEDITYEEIEYPDKKYPLQWYLGAMAAKNNTWLLNYQTRQGLNPGQLNQTNLTYTTEFGILGGVDVAPGMQLQFEWYINSQTGQSYQEYINALRVVRAVKLDYNKFQILGIRDLRKKGAIAMPFVAAGFYAAHLKEANEIIDGEISNISNEYVDMDLGLSIGIGLRYSLTENFILQPSLRSSYSLKNTYRGNDVIPGTFLPSRNAQIGINLGIHFLF
ncbi:MAG: hypothetical protein JJU28_15010 [Cyclobacteriaceae bacterium]|nr:hypothetical protein [Cyclobacteriaceae bacterium]